MKKILLFLTFIFTLQGNNTIELAVSGAQQTKTPVTIIVLDKTNTELINIAAIIAKDLQFTDQFTVTTQKFDASLPKKELFKNIQQSAKTSGTPLALCLNTDESTAIEWRLYETMEGSMLAGKKYSKQGDIPRVWAHAIADKIWHALTGNSGFFSSRIAYCTESKNPDNSINHHIYITDFDGSNTETILTTSNIVVAPRWNTDYNNPALFYSQYTKTNVQLLSTPLKPSHNPQWKKETKIASNFDGVNMLPSFSPNGQALAYCASRGNGTCQLYYCTKNSVKQFTKNDGNNVSPIFIDEDRICFCSDVHTGNPQIYIGNLKTGHVKRITKGGYCTSPHYCAKNNTLAYHKMVNGVMQIFTYDLSTKIHTQLTKGNANKYDASWSPDGTHLLFAQEHNKSNRLVVLNILTKTTHFLTNKDQICTYPNWSPIYTHFPVYS